MGVLDRFEKGLERALSSTFARAFKADLKPVDIASSIRREMDERTASLSRGRTVVPNSFVVELAPSDLEQVDKWGKQELTDELITAATDHATDQGYVFVGRVTVNFEQAEDRKAGDFLIRSSSQRVTPDGFGSPSSVAPDAHSPANDPVGTEHPAQPFAESAMSSPDDSSPASSPAASAHAARQPAANPIHSRPILDVDGQRYLLTGPVTIIGRGSESDIIVSDSGVSRQHLEIRLTSDGVTANDLGSTNGSYVEGHRIDAATLVDGNTITVGRTQIIFWDSQDGVA